VAVSPEGDDVPPEACREIIVTFNFPVDLKTVVPSIRLDAGGREIAFRASRPVIRDRRQLGPYEDADRLVSLTPSVELPRDTDVSVRALAGAKPRPGTYDPADPIGSLDVSILQKSLLDPVLGVADPRTDKRIDFVGGIRGTAGLEKKVDGGAFQAAFSLYPTTIDQLFAVADSGLTMPPKSTWFEPKIKDGLAVHMIDE